MEKKLQEQAIIYQWESKAITDSFDIWYRRIKVLILSWTFPLIIIAATLPDAADIFAILCMAAFASFMARFFAMPDITYKYTLTKLGIYYTYEYTITDNASMLIRAIGWIGIIVCFIAFYYIGPMAFVGAGACALLSFQLVGFKSKPYSCYVLLSSNTIIFNKLNSNKLSLHPKDCRNLTMGECFLEYISDLYFSSRQQKEEFLDHLKSALTQYEEYDVKRWKDRDCHPVINDFYIKLEEIQEEEQAKKDNGSSKS